MVFVITVYRQVLLLLIHLAAVTLVQIITQTPVQNQAQEQDVHTTLLGALILLVAIIIIRRTQAAQKIVKTVHAVVIFAQVIINQLVEKLFLGQDVNIKLIGAQTQVVVISIFRLTVIVLKTVKIVVLLLLQLLATRQQKQWGIHQQKQWGIHQQKQ